MPVFINESPKGTIFEVEFGTGDIGFRAGLVKNYPTESGYERRVVVEVHELDRAYGAGAKIGDTQAEVLSKFIDPDNPAVVLTFPANDVKSLDSIIKTLTKIRNDVYGTPYWALVYADRLGMPLEDWHAIYDDYTKAVNELQHLSKEMKWPEGYVVVAKVDVKEDNVRKVGDKLFPSNRPTTSL